MNVSRRTVSQTEVFRRAAPDFFAGGPEMPPKTNSYRRKLVEALSSDPPAVILAIAAVEAWAANKNDPSLANKAQLHLIEKFREGARPAKIAEGIERLLAG